MKKTWTKFLSFLLLKPKSMRFFLSIFSCLLLLLFGLGGKQVKATNVIDNQWFVASVGFSDGNAQVFKAQHNSITAFSFYASYTSTPGGHICEVSTATSHDCLATPIDITNCNDNSLAPDPNNPSTCAYRSDSVFYTFVLTSPLTGTLNHYYMIWSSGLQNSFYGTMDYPISYGGYTTYGSYWNSTGYPDPYPNNVHYILEFNNYYDDTLETYCGDTICNGSENFENCSADCLAGIDYHTNSIIVPPFYSVGYLLYSHINVFPYSYDTNSSVGEGDYITLDRCDSYNPGDLTACDRAYPVVFDTGAATSTHSNLYSEFMDYGQSSFAISSDDAINIFGQSSDVLVLYKITPYFQCALGVCIRGIPQIIPINWLSAINSAYASTTVILPYSDLTCTTTPFDDSNICDGMNTTTSDFLGIKWGQVWCDLIIGVNRSSYFLFTPTCTSLNYFKSNYDTLKQGFPFNAYFQFTGTINTAIDSANLTSSTSSSTIGIPFINYNSTSSNKFYIMPIISSSSMPNAIGTNNNTLFRTTLAFLGWIIVAFLIWITIRKV